jgi:hypothetical protein
MPIINLQRKLTEVGRIRLGAKSEKGAPTKLDKFRLTSKSREALEAAAEAYGGVVKSWSGPDGDAFELITTTSVLDVTIPPGSAISQWYEMWSGAGCQRRCDGETETLSGRPCICPTDQQQRMEASARGQACRPTTRLSVILPKVKTVGIWRLESHGYNTASEMAGIAELLENVSANNNYLPATLRLEQRSARRNGKLSRFAVPVLMVGATVQEAIQAASGELPNITQRPALTSARPEAPMPEPGFDEEAPTLQQPKEVIVAEVIDVAVEEPTFEEPTYDEPSPLDANPFTLDEPAAPVVEEPKQARKPLNQVQRIQILRRELDLTEDQYRAGLAKYGATSSKDLTEAQAAEVIERLTAAVAKKKANNA